jgi:hypothetical protein
MQDIYPFNLSHPRTRGIMLVLPVGPISALEDLLLLKPSIAITPVIRLGAAAHNPQWVREGR